MTDNAITTNEAPELVREILDAGLVPLLKSSPGLGKSSIIRQIADERKLKVIDIRLSQCDPTDLNGLPTFTKDGKATFAPMDWFPTEDTPIPLGYKGWLIFFDELTSAPKSIQAAAYKPLLEREVAGHKIHSKVQMAAAGNLITDGAVVHALSTALGSRLIHLTMKVNLKAFMQHALRNKFDSRMLAFLEMKPTLLHDFNPKVHKETFPCPRTWEFMSDLIKGKEVNGARLPMLMGTVGPGAAAEFFAFTELGKDLPSMATILKDPEGVKIPKANATKYFVTGMIASEVNADNIKQIMQFVDRLGLEFIVIFLRMAYHNKRELIRVPEFNQKLRQHSRELKEYV